MRVLHVVSVLQSGGIETMLYRYLHYMKDRDITFEIMTHDENEQGMLYQRFLQLGIRIYRIPSKHTSLRKNLVAMNNIIAHGAYDVIHVHQGYLSCFPLLIARFHNVPLRITHAHSTYALTTQRPNLMIRLMKFLNVHMANDYYATGPTCGELLYGKKRWKEHGFLMYNAMSLSDFQFDEATRIQYRRHYQLQHKRVLLVISRLSKEKNIAFTIRLMKLLDDQYHLVIVGEGEQKAALTSLTMSLGLQEQITFLGQRNDVCALLDMSDILLVPSFYEGFCISAIEAQINGLQVILSDTIPQETDITHTCLRASIQSKEEWAEKFMNLPRMCRHNNDKMVFRELSIETAAVSYERRLKEMIK